jgi:DNA repair ATPase RecN
MKTTDEYGQMLDEFIHRSAKIDELVAKYPQTPEMKQELEELRVKQRETNERLQKFEVSSNKIWENIGHGG